MPHLFGQLPIDRRMRQIALAAAAAVAAIGGYFLLAWLSGAMTYRGFQTITIKTNAALCLLLCGLALLFTLLSGTRGPILLAQLFASLSLIIGGLTFTEHLTGLDFRIDQLVAEEPPGAFGILHPNRMGPPGALGITLGGAALLLLQRGRKAVQAAQWLGVSVCLVGLLGMLGYLYGAEVLYGVARYTAIPWQTTVALFLLGVGILFARPRDGLMAQVSSSDPGGVAVRRMAPYALLLPALFAWLRLQGEWHGLYGRYFGTSILALALVASFTVLVYRTGRYLSRAAEAEQAAVEAEKRTQAILREAELSHTGAWEWDIATGRWTFSEEWLRIHGCERGTLSDDELLAIAHPEDRETIVGAFKELRSGKSPYDLEHRIVRQDTGEVRTVRSRGQFMKDDTGRVVRVYGFARDVSEQKQVENEASIQRQLLESVVANTPAGIIVARGEDLRIVLVNPQYQALAPGKEMLGRTVEEVWPEIQPWFGDIQRGVARSGIPHHAVDDRILLTRSHHAPLEERFFTWSTVRVPLPGSEEWGVLTTAWETTERKRTEDELKSTGELLNKVLASLPVGVWILDREGKAILVNDAARAIWGGDLPLAPGQFGEYKGWRLETGERIQPEEWGGARAVRKGEASEEVVEIECFDGTRKIVVNASLPLRDDHGEITGAITVNHDITDRKWAEFELRESEARYRSLFENSPDAILVTIPDGRIISANQTAEAMFRMTEQEISSAGRRGLVPPGDDRVEILAKERDRTGTSRGVVTYLRKDGSTFDGEMVSVLMPGSDRAFVIIRDITERVRAEEALRESETRFRALFEQAAVGMGLASFTDARWITVNEAFCRMLGYSEEYMRATPWPKITHPEDVTIDLVPFRRMAAGELESYTVEKRFVHREGHHVWARLTLSLVRDEQGRPDYEIAIVEDVTERKHVQDELHLAKEELEVRVRERTRELRQALEDLRSETAERFQAVEELRARDHLLLQQSRLAAMGEMLVNISHQWRQPLNVIGLILQDLKRSHERGRLTGDLLEKGVARARELIAHMSQTIDDFRDYLKPERVRSSFDLAEAVEKAVAMVSEGLKGVELEIRKEPEGSIMVEGYRNEMTQAIMNILINARDVFRERKTANPAIRIRVFKEAGRRVITIADNGGGIAPEIMEKIFEPYFTTKDPDKGTGVGLFMSMNIVEKSMGGSLSVRNTGEGAEFRIEV